MSFRGFLFALAVIVGLLFYFDKPQQWWGAMRRAATQVHATPSDSVP